MAGLLEYNPASHLIWWVAAGLFATLGVMLAVELWDALRGLSARWRREGPDFARDLEDVDDRFVLRSPDSELRRRTDARVEPYRRTWHEGRPNDPARHH